MFQQLTKTQFLALAEKKKYVAVYKELLADTFTPISVFENLVPSQDTAILLESSLKFNESGAYSFIGFSPYATFQTKNGKTDISAIDEKPVCYHNAPILPLLRKFHQTFSCITDDHSQLVGHMMGFLAYDAIRYFESISDRHIDDPDIPDILFHFYRINLVFKHDTQQFLVSVIANTQFKNPEIVYEEAQAQLQTLIGQLARITPTAIILPNTNECSAAGLTDTVFKTDCDDTMYCKNIEKAKSYIQSGDVFQLVLSRTFSYPLKTSPLTIYRILRQSNPAPYLFYMVLPQLTLLGASPEKLVSMNNQIATIAPIAGTISVGEADSNTALLEKLRNDPKECAEHQMLVDLARNDIGCVCEPGSVHVCDLMTGERLTHVMHLVSHVRGKLAPGYDAFDLLRATFPAGTLSGTPKIRAMQLIDQLESSKRHLYGGAICKIDGQGNLDSCIIIRSGMIKNDTIYVRAGAGIVYDSVAMTEARETNHKAKGMLQSVMIALLLSVVSPDK